MPKHTESILQRYEMSQRDIVYLACKSVAIILFFRAIHGGFFALIGIISGIQTSEISRGILVSNVYGLVGNLLVIAFCVLLWFKSKTVTTKFASKSASNDFLLIDDNLAPSIIALAGIIVFILALSPFVGVWSQVLAPASLESPVGWIGIDKIRYMNPDEMIHLLTFIIQMTLGIGLFFGAQRISNTLRNRYRETVES